MDESTKQKGQKGEDIAVGYLQGKGYSIVIRNFKYSNRGELDIVAKDGDFLVFVEVRSKSKEDGITPEDTVTKAKIKQVKKMADFYLYVNKIKDQLCRIDVITVLFNDGDHIINHYENVTM